MVSAIATNRSPKLGRNWLASGRISASHSSLMRSASSTFNPYPLLANWWSGSERDLTTACWNSMLPTLVPVTFRLSVVNGSTR